MENDNFNSDERDYGFDPFNNTTSSDVIDSRSFTQPINDWNHSEQGWARGTQYQSESYKKESWNRSYVSRDNEANPRRLLVAIIASIVTFIFLAAISLFVYDINYWSTGNMLVSVIPSVCMFSTFRRINLRINKLESVILFFLNCILLYLMFHAIMARGIQKLLPEIEPSFWDCCKIVNAMRHTESLKEIYYTHFFWIMGFNLFVYILAWITQKKEGKEK